VIRVKDRTRLIKDETPILKQQTKRLNNVIQTLNLMNYEARWEAITAPHIILENCPYADIAKFRNMPVNNILLKNYSTIL
jgi:hypothetical protein